MALRRARVEGAARLAFVRHVFSAQMFLRCLTAGVHLFQESVARFAFRVAFAAHSLRGGNALRRVCD